MQAMANHPHFRLVLSELKEAKSPVRIMTISATIASGMLAPGTSHGEVGQIGERDDENSEDVVEMLRLWWVSLWKRCSSTIASLTIGIFQARPEKTTVAAVMTMKTTLSNSLAYADGEVEALLQITQSGRSIVGVYA
jgi:hypothetical protein